jgi:hypothetical protein
MRLLGKIIGYAMWLTSGILLFIFWFVAMNHWLGGLGSILSFVLSPGLGIFPIVFWIVEGVFPVMYFVIWGIGIIGLIITAIATRD